MRLDVYLFENKYYQSRQKAQYAIEEGLITVNNKVITKSSFNVEENDTVVAAFKSETYVSRAGYKLSKALKEFDIDCKNAICLDIGSSTGGFTDCLIQHGASKVYATDVGTDQLDQSLRNNPNIISKEKLNFRVARKEDFDNTMFRIVSIDVSFISLNYIFENLSNFIDEESIVISLIKPQFELYEESNKHKGIIRDKYDHIKAINKVINDAKQHNLYVQNLTFSPILGEKKGNIEFLASFKLNGSESNINIQKIVEKAHKELI